MILVLLSLLLSLAIIIISAVKHKDAIDTCQRLFSADATDDTGEGICNIWTWVQVGIMGLLFIIVGLCEVRANLFFSLLSILFARLTRERVSDLFLDVFEYLLFRTKTRPVRRF